MKIRLLEVKLRNGRNMLLRASAIHNVVETPYGCEIAVGSECVACVESYDRIRDLWVRALEREGE